MSETSTSASLAAATAAASPGIVNWADDVDDELKPSAAKNAAAGAGGGDDDDAPPGFEHVSPAAAGGAAADPADALVAKIGGVAVSLEEEAGFFKRERETDRIVFSTFRPPFFQTTPPPLPSQKKQMSNPAAEQMDEPEPATSLQDIDPTEGDVRAVPAGETPYTSASAFEDLPLSPALLQGLYTEMKFEKPSRIQAVTLPMILTPPYRSMIAQAHNGSGKTTCFVLSMLSRVDPSEASVQALCVCPTRELVVQNLQVLRRMAKFTTITSTSTAGDGSGGDGGGAAAGNGGGDGAPSSRQQEKITEHVVIGTHGKLKSWVSRRAMPVDSVKILVFDEADEMLKTDAFASDSVRLISTVRQAVSRRASGGAAQSSPAVDPLQILLFSATFNEKVKAFALKVVPGANQVFVPREQLSLDVIKQYRVVCPEPLAKVSVLKDAIFPQCEKLGQTIIFVRTRDTARALHAAMEADGHRCTSIEGGMDKDARDRVVAEFRSGATKVLISTDVLSRGFDVTQVTLVVNFDVPTERDFRTPAFETYLHRIGRSGRFGRKGAAFNLVCGPSEAAILDEIARYFKHDIPSVPWNDEEAFARVLKEAGLTEGGDAAL